MSTIVLRHSHGQYHSVLWHATHFTNHGLFCTSSVLASGTSSVFTSIFTMLTKSDTQTELDYKLTMKIYKNKIINLTIDQTSKSCTYMYTLFLPHGIEIELIFALWAMISEIRTDFQNCHIWAWNLAISQSFRSCTYTPSNPRGRNWAYFHFTGSGFRDTGPIFKIAIFYMKLGH